MDLRLPHFMKHRIDCCIGEFVNEYRIIVMRKGVNLLIEFITEEQWLVAKINFDIHRKWEDEGP